MKFFWPIPGTERRVIGSKAEGWWLSFQNKVDQYSVFTDRRIYEIKVQGQQRTPITITVGKKVGALAIGYDSQYIDDTVEVIYEVTGGHRFCVCSRHFGLIEGKPIEIDASEVTVMDFEPDDPDTLSQTP